MARPTDWGPPPTDDEQSVPADYLDAIEARLGPVIPTRVGAPPLQIFYRPDVRWVAMGKRSALPHEFMALVTDPRYPGCVLDLEVEAGVVVCNRLTFVRRPGGPPLRATEIRRPVDKFRLEAASVAAAEIVEQNDDDGTITLRRGDFADLFHGEYDVRKERGQRRGARLSDAHLREVADVYRTALADPDASVRRAPARQVATHMHTTPENARRWLQIARRRGILGPAAPRRAGELGKENDG